MTFSWVSGEGACCPSSDGILHFCTVSCLSLFLFETLPLSNAQVLQFFNFSLFSPCLLRFPHCFLSPGRNTVGRDWYTRDILLLVFNFLLKFLLDDIDFQCKGRSALEQTCREIESLRPAVRLESPCPSNRNWHLCETVGHAPDAGNFLQ